MAKIQANTNEKVFTINRWLGLNQAEDGDTQLKMGEAAKAWNFRISRDGHLQKRPGSKTVIDLDTALPIKGLWSGYVNSVHVLLGACGGKLYSFRSATGEWQNVEIGAVSTTGNVHIFGFAGNAYILAQNEYKVWDGTTLSTVEGYVPLVRISAPPAGGGEDMENINRLTGKRRMWFSPDGEAATFYLPEKGQHMVSIDSVKDLATGELLAGYTTSTAAGSVTFSAPPAKGTNSIEIAWTMDTNFRQQVTAMEHSELYNSTQDTRVFLYGDGSNKCIYSEADYDGIPRADYFPDLYEIAVGDANTPITAMIRHYSTLVCYKSASTYSIRYGDITLSDGTVTAAFYTQPINRSIGCNAAGQAQIVLNTPRTLFGHDLYEWKNNSSYSSNLTADERQAKIISERINALLKQFNIPSCVCYDDNDAQEYYICYDDKCLVNNYVADAWSYYIGLDIRCITRHGEFLVFGTSDGRIKEINYSYTSDDGAAIDCYYETGSMDFGQSYMRKYSSMMWIGITPETKTSLTFTGQTDKSSGLAEKTIDAAASAFDFENIDFGNMDFDVDVRPKIHRLKIKAKKFVYYKLILSSRNTDAHATVVSFNMKVRYTSMAK